MMALIQDAVQRGLDLNWEYAAKQVHPECSGDALKQQLNKRRDKLIAQGAPVGPLSSRARQSRRPRNATDAQLQAQQSQDGTPQQLHDHDLLSHVTYGHSTPLDGTASMAILTNPQTPTRPKRRHSNDSSETPTKNAKSYGDDDVFLDNDDDADQECSDEDVSDWASGKPARKKAKRGRPSKGSLVVKLKTSKRNRSAGVSNMPLTLSTGSSNAKKVHFEDETLTDKAAAVSNMPLTPSVGSSTVEKERSVEDNSADEATAPRKNRTYSTTSKPYSTEVVSAPNVFSSGPSPMMYPSANQYGNFGMMNNLNMSTDLTMMNHPFAGAYEDNFITEPVFKQNRLFGMPNQVLIDTSSFHQYGSVPNFNPSSLASYGSGLGLNYPGMSQSAGAYGQFAPNSIMPGTIAPQSWPPIRRASDPSRMHERHLITNPTNINYVGLQEPSTPPPKEWDFPNARMDAPIFGDESEASCKRTDNSKSYNLPVVPVYANTLLGSFTTFETPVAPTMPTPVSLNRPAETPSPTDSSVVSPHKPSFMNISNSNENLTAEAVEKSEDNVDFEGMVEFNPHEATTKNLGERLRYSNTPTPFGY